MGYNSTIVILNDGLHSIANDKEFGKKIYDAIGDLSGNKDGVTLYSGNGNVGEVVETHHADESRLIAVGGNCGTNLCGYYSFNHPDKEVQVELLRAFADKLGYEIPKKPQKKR